MGQSANQTESAVNDNLSMSPDAQARMRRREVDVFKYYDDMGPGKGNCTWGAGILAHRGHCSSDELGKKVSRAEVDAEFARRVAKAEREVRRNVTSHALTQAQFDSLVSLTYNTGARGASGTFDLVDSGDLEGAADNISKLTKTMVNGKRVVARGLIPRRAEEAAPFRSVESARPAN
ncbi:lysozyme [Massilia sp. TWR1-2-2]|uniref:lysozyme n=1 Tax=Massilia sp. TWR1-2-2 TaxID=2804584 RepID=UPI003CF2E173